MMVFSTNTRSSLELLLESIRQRDEQLTDAPPPALPVRPPSKARFPPVRRPLPANLRNRGLRDDPAENVVGRNTEERESKFQLGVFESSRMKEIELLDVVDDPRERLLKGVLEIQKYFRGHQARCYYVELKRGTIVLQSFIRGEKARKDYKVSTRRLAAAIVVQKHMKEWIERRRQRAAICLQSAIRSWLTRRCDYEGNFRLPGIKPIKDIRQPVLGDTESKDYIHVSASAITDLRRQLLKVETELGQKEEENAALRQQLKQFDEKWSRYEAKMKAMEKSWQDQLTSLQMSLAAAKKSLASECTANQNGIFDPFPLYNCCDVDDTMPTETQATNARSPLDLSDSPCDTKPQETNRRLDDIHYLSEQSKKVFHDNAVIAGKLKSVHLASSVNPDKERRKLKHRFEAWKKDYKIRLQETKAMLQKLGTKNSRKKMVGKVNEKGH